MQCPHVRPLTRLHTAAGVSDNHCPHPPGTSTGTELSAVVQRPALPMEAWAQYLLTISIDGEVTGEGSLGSTACIAHHALAHAHLFGLHGNDSQHTTVTRFRYHN
jgi:hypothetical protein